MPKERITVDREQFEELCRDQRLLQCLEAAGIDNCEAYSIGYQEFAAQEKEDDDEPVEVTST
jgi:hypothetical protein